MDSPLAELLREASKLWAAYQVEGPSSLPQDSLDSFLKAEANLLELRRRKAKQTDAARVVADIKEIVTELEGLLRRCVERTEGLCFVTGEAGLIPRRDLHDRCEVLLAELASISTRLL